VLLLAFFICYKLAKAYGDAHTELTISYRAKNDDIFQLFFDDQTEYHFNEDNSVYLETIGNRDFMTIGVIRAKKDFKALRIDLGEYNNNLVEIRSIKISSVFGEKVLDKKDIFESFTFYNTLNVSCEETGLFIIKDSVDAYFYTNNLDLTQQMSNSFLMIVFLMWILVISTLSIVYRLTPIRYLLKELYTNRALILSLSKNDFKTKYAGSYLGIIWAFIQPIVTVLVYTFVFTVGFRSGSMDGVPFVNWLTAGILPWYFFSDALINGSNSLLEYSYLVKKVVFNINILPVVKTLSSLFVHIVFALIVILLYLCTGFYPDLYWFQMFYYCACTFLLSIGLSYLCSAMILFFKDLGQIINVILQIGVWMTPIMWSSDIIQNQFIWIFKLNPMYYIVQGYRNCLIYKEWFWESYVWTIYFWTVTLAVLFIGMMAFKKLKRHFADVL
jgi:teichoic acid transport system permease protein